MSKRKKTKSTAGYVRERIDREGDRYWRASNFPDHPPGAVAQALSRLVAEGPLERVYKGIYYMPDKTVFGQTTYSTSALNAEALKTPVFPAGTAAANLLGFTSQNPMRPEFATPAHYVPKVLEDAIVYTGRPEAWSKLEVNEGAALSFLRDRGRSSELSDDETAQDIVSYFRKNPDSYQRLIKIADSEPARVRAMLGAIGQELKATSSTLKRLRDSLSIYSRYDFGRLRRLRYAREWQVK